MNTCVATVSFDQRARADDVAPDRITTARADGSRLRARRASVNCRSDCHCGSSRSNTVSPDARAAVVFPAPGGPHRMTTRRPSTPSIPVRPASIHEHPSRSCNESAQAAHSQKRQHHQAPTEQCDQPSPTSDQDAQATHQQDRHKSGKPNRHAQTHPRAGNAHTERHNASLDDDYDRDPFRASPTQRHEQQRPHGNATGKTRAPDGGDHSQERNTCRGDPGLLCGSLDVQPDAPNAHGHKLDVAAHQAQP